MGKKYPDYEEELYDDDTESWGDDAESWEYDTEDEEDWEEDETWDQYNNSGYETSQSSQRNGRGTNNTVSKRAKQNHNGASFKEVRRNKSTRSTPKSAKLILVIVIGAILVVLIGNFVRNYKDNKNNTSVDQYNNHQTSNTNYIPQGTIYADKYPGDPIDESGLTGQKSEKRIADIIMANKEILKVGNQLNYYIYGTSTNNKDVIRVKVTSEEYEKINKNDLILIEYKKLQTPNGELIYDEILSPEWEEFNKTIENTINK